jgi:hypothetical protein
MTTRADFTGRPAWEQAMKIQEVILKALSRVRQPKVIGSSPIGRTKLIND